jgi:predicted alpha/beta hydrolase family esterase
LRPEKNEWINVISSFQPDENWILIGHSLGGTAILGYLEETSKPVSQIILVSTPFDAMSFGTIDNFYSGGFDWGRIKEKAGKIDLIYEDNDPVVPKEHGEKYTKYLSGNLHIIHGFTHTSELDLKILEKIIQEKS